MTSAQINDALIHQVPAMIHGFTINTNFGPITIQPGWVASRLAEHTERALRCELLEQGKNLPERGLS